MGLGLGLGFGLGLGLGLVAALDRVEAALEESAVGADH